MIQYRGKEILEVKNFLRSVFVAILLTAMAAVPMQLALANDASKTSYAKKHSDTILHVKFAETDEIALDNDKFISKNGKDLSRINAALHSSKAAQKSQLFTANPETIKEQRKQLKAKAGSSYVPNLNNYYRVVLQPGEDINAVIRTLKTLPNVSEVYAEPLAVKAPAPKRKTSTTVTNSPDYTGTQTHFTAAPNGMGIEAAATYPGALGERIRIADIEYNWNTAHEDLSDARQSDTLIANGTPVDPFNDNNHGTAVAGLLNGDRNNHGINGIVSNAKLHLVNATNAERGWDIHNAIYAAQSRLEAGDVLLIEQQTWGPEGRGFMPVEWVPAAYDAIKFATLNGVVVVEAAANGGENLDDPIFGSTFPQGKADSGAIIVGAGTACGGTDKHSRLPFSNYGSRVNVQGYGECVVTSGYGYLNYSAGTNAWYTNSFNGTSSASALVAALAGSVSSSYEYQKNINLTPLQLRELLIQTGTIQDTSINPGNVGPLPNLEAALRSFSPSDSVPPTAPTNLEASLKKDAISLSWNISNDNSATVTYRVYRNSVLIATTANPSYVDGSVAKRTTYSYKVQAVDPSGNQSSFSNTVTVKTR